MFSKRFSHLLIFVISPAILIYITILSFALKEGIEPHLVTRDLIQTCKLPIAYGMLSNLGILLWAAAAGITFFASQSALIQNKSIKNYLTIGSIFTSILCIDDLFLLHDFFIEEKALYLIYALMAFYLLLSSRQQDLRAHSYSFFIAAMLLGLSIICDKLQGRIAISYSDLQVFEEGFKFIGIACWLYYWWQASLTAIKSRAG